MKVLKMESKKLADLHLPEILKNTIITTNLLYPNISNNIKLNILITKCFQMFSSKRIKLDESRRIKLINWFAIVFFSSGGGKDRLVDDMDEFIFKKYHEWYKNEAQNAIEKCNNKTIHNMKLINEVQDSTLEATLSLAKIMKEINFGSIFIKINEFGDYIKNSDKKRKMFLSMLNQLYSCVVPNKIIKSEIFGDEIENIPVNVLAYSDYTLFKNEMMSYFNNILNTGYARRFMFSFQELKELMFNPLSDEEERQIYNSLENYGNNLFEIFTNIPIDTCFKLTSNSKNILNEYKAKICQMYNSEQEPLLQKEIKSRELKALKLSCLFAVINHNSIYEIQEEDIFQAIDTVEFLSRDFKKFLRYKPLTDDKYTKAYQFLRENEGREFTKTQILQIFTSQFGFSREPLRRNFYETLCIIWEIAQQDDYTIIYYDNKCKHGTYLSLVKNEYAIATTNCQRTMSPSVTFFM